MLYSLVFLFFFTALKAETFTMTAGEFTIQVNSHLQTKINTSSFAVREELVAQQNESFNLRAQKVNAGVLTIEGETNSGFRKILTFESVGPGRILQTVEFQNHGKKDLRFKGWRSARFQMNGNGQSVGAFLPGSYEPRPDWIKEIKPGFRQVNFMGMNATDYGGGTPLLAIWNKDQGFSIASVEPKSELIALPIAYHKSGWVQISMQSDRGINLPVGASFTLPRILWQSFRGDVFQPLRNYSLYMSEKSGLKMAPSPMAQMGPIWCAWGYGRNFTIEQVMATLPLAKALGFEWVGIDDGWQEAIGDWSPNRKKFPNGDQDMRKLVQAIHDQGMKAQLWWAPFAVHRKSEYVREHADELLLNRNQTKRDISWWDAWYQCPASEKVRKEMSRLATQFIGEWGFDGLKIDGQHLNAAPECFNKAHLHSRPQESHQEFAQAFREIFESAQKANGRSVVEVCPCGTAYSIYHLPFQNMTVASDPESSLQVRQKGKVLKALTGDQTVYFGDHVELSEKGRDFASTLAVGGLPGSNFTKLSFNMKPQPSEPDTRLTPEREVHFKKWIALAKEKRPWEGDYLGALYDVVFDKPEGHVVRRGEHLSYGFFADKFAGQVELRGLGAGVEYEVFDVVENKKLGQVKGPLARLSTEFTKFLWLEAIPMTKGKLK